MRVAVRVRIRARVRDRVRDLEAVRVPVGSGASGIDEKVQYEERALTEATDQKGWPPARGGYADLQLEFGLGLGPEGSDDLLEL